MCSHGLFGNSSYLRFNCPLFSFNSCTLLTMLLRLIFDDLPLLLSPSGFSFEHLLLMRICTLVCILTSPFNISYLCSCIFGLSFQVVQSLLSIIWFPLKHSKPTLCQLSSTLCMFNPCISKLCLLLCMDYCLPCLLFSFIYELLLVLVPLYEWTIMFFG